MKSLKRLREFKGIRLERGGEYQLVVDTVDKVHGVVGSMQHGEMGHLFPEPSEASSSRSRLLRNLLGRAQRQAVCKVGPPR